MSALPALPLGDTTTHQVDVVQVPEASPTPLRQVRGAGETVRAWQIQHKSAPRAHAEAIEEHFIAGGSFSWTPPGEVTAITARYTTPLTITRHAGDVVDIAFRIQKLN